jgi:hypothetical protein
MILVGLNIEKIGVSILFVTLSVLLLIIIYRKIIAYFEKGKIQNENYCFLYRIEKQPVKGEIEFYFTLEEPKFVDFEILNFDFTPYKSLASKEFSKGGHILRMDSTELKNGTYYYQITTENQKTYKKLEIKN